MPSQSITQLNALAENAVDAVDVLPIVDISASETKKVTAKDLFEAGAALADSSSIDLIKLNQASATKLATVAIADDAITAAKLANDSSINYGPTEPAADNFEGRGHVNSTTKYLKIYDGSVYQQVIAPTAGIEDLAVATGKIAANAVTTAKIDANGLAAAAIATDAVITAKIQALAVTEAKLAAGSVTETKIGAGAVVAAKMATDAIATASIIALNVTEAKIAAGAVTEAKIGTGAVTETKIGAGAVTVAKIADTQITYAKLNLADGSVPGVKLVDASVTAAKLGTDSVITAKINALAVTEAKIAAGAVTETKIADDAITAAKIATNAVGALELANDAVDTASIVNSAVTEAKIGTGAVTVTKIADTSITYAKLNVADNVFPGAKLVDGSVVVAKLATDSVSTAKIVNDAVTTAKIADDAITADQLATGSVTADAIAADAVTASELADNAVDTTSIVALAVTEAKIAAGAVTEAKIGTGAVNVTKIADTSITYAKLNVADNVFPGAKLVDTSVTAAKLGTDSVSTAKVIDLAVTTGKLAAGAVTTAKIAAGAVTATEIAADAVTTAKVIDDAVTYAKIQNVTATDKLLGRATAGAGNIEEITLTAAGRALLDDADAATQRTTLGLGTIATQSAGAIAVTGGTLSGLTSIAAITATLTNATITAGSVTGITDITVADGGTGASDASTARTNLGVAIGTNVQAYDAGLQSIAGLTTSANELIYTTAADTYTTTSLTSYGRSLIDDADAATARSTLGLGTLATQNGTFSGTTSGTNTGDQTITLTGDVTGTGTGSFATTIVSNAVTTAKILNSNITTDKIANDAVTAAKLADNSSATISGNAPTGSGDFTGQQWINTNTGLAYAWDGSAWLQQAGVQSFVFTDTSPLTFSSTVNAAGLATITTGLDTQTAATIFAGPTTGSATAPTFRTLIGTDLPVATSSVNGAMQPGTGLTVTGGGVLNHTNSATAGTYTKVTVDSQGHVSTGATLNAGDIPSLDASKITTGTFNSAFLAANSVTATQLADYGIAQVSESAPEPEFAGQWWINPSDRSAYIWVGTVSPSPNGYWLLVGYGTPTQLNLRFGGTYNATTNLIVSLNQYGTEAGLTVGQALTAPNPQNNGVYLIATTAGTGTTPAPAVALAIGDWCLSQGTGANWTKIGVVSGAAGTFSDYQVLCDGTYFAPDMTAVADVRGALTLLWGRAQIATTVQIGVVLESTEVLVDNSTGAMSIGTVDDGTY